MDYFRDDLYKIWCLLLSLRHLVMQNLMFSCRKWLNLTVALYDFGGYFWGIWLFWVPPCMSKVCVDLPFRNHLRARDLFQSILAELDVVMPSGAGAATVQMHSMQESERVAFSTDVYRLFFSTGSWRFILFAPEDATNSYAAARKYIPLIEVVLSGRNLDSCPFKRQSWDKSW